MITSDHNDQHFKNVLIQFKLYDIDVDHGQSINNQLMQFLYSLPGIISVSIDIESSKISILMHPDRDNCHPAKLYRSLQQEFPKIYFDYQDPLDQRYKCQIESILRAKTIQKWRKRSILAAIIVIVELFLYMILYNVTNWFTIPFVSNQLTLGTLIECILANILMFSSIGRSFFNRATMSLFHYQHITMDALIIMGSGVSWFFSMFSVIFCLLYSTPQHAFKLMHSMIFFDTSISLLSAACIGRYLEALAKSKTSKELQSILFHSKPFTANLVMNHAHEIFTCPASLILSGDIIWVSPGEYIPVDGQIIKNHGIENNHQIECIFVDESNLTGESRPMTKNIGDIVYAGTMLGCSTEGIHIMSIKDGSDSLCNQLSMTMDHSRYKSTISSKSVHDNIQHLSFKMASFFFPIILSLGMISFVFWILMTTFFDYQPPQTIDSGEPGWVFSLKIFISVITISCPCILGLVMPTITLIGTGLAARYKILLGHPSASDYNENSTGKQKRHYKKNIRSAMDVFALGSNITAVLFDKTGTLTTGNMILNHIYWISQKNEEIDDLKGMLCKSIILVECDSCHPIGKAIHKGFTDIMKTFYQSDNYSESSTFNNIKLVKDSLRIHSGLGIQCTIEISTEIDVNHYHLLLGNDEWMMQNNISLTSIHDNIDNTDKSIDVYIHFAWNGSHMATLTISDELEPDCHKVIEWLHRNSYKTGLLTGDNRSTAMRVASKVGIPLENVYASLTSEQKKMLIYDFQQGKSELVGIDSQESIDSYDRFIISGLPVTPSQSSLHPRNKIMSDMDADDIQQNIYVCKTMIKEKIVMVGDGVNDGLALEQADIGIAFCRQYINQSTHPNTTSIASLSTILSANVTLFGKSLTNVVTFLDLSKKICKRLAWNFLWACLYNVISIPIAMGVFLPMFGIISSPILSSLTMSFSSLSVLVSSLALDYLYHPPISPTVDINYSNETIDSNVESVAIEVDVIQNKNNNQSTISLAKSEYSIFAENIDHSHPPSAISIPNHCYQRDMKNNK